MESYDTNLVMQHNFELNKKFAINDEGKKGHLSKIAAENEMAYYCNQKTAVLFMTSLGFTIGQMTIDSILDIHFSKQ